MPDDIRPTVLLLSTSFLAVTRLRQVIARESALRCHCVGTVGRARESLDRDRIVALVLEPEDASGAWIAPLARESRSTDPARPIVAIVRRAAGWSPSALALLATKPEMVVLAEDLDAGAVLRAIAPPLRAADLVAEVWPLLEGDVPPALRPIVRFALARAASPLPVAEFALALGLHRKTLWLRCRRHGLASVQALMMWCRLLAVSHALRTRPHSVEWIANEMEFASPTSLRNVTRRYLGVTPTALRADGALTLVSMGFRRWLRGGDRDARGRHASFVGHDVTASDAA